MQATQALFELNKKAQKIGYSPLTAAIFAHLFDLCACHPRPKNLVMDWFVCGSHDGWEGYMVCLTSGVSSVWVPSDWIRFEASEEIGDLLDTDTPTLLSNPVTLPPESWDRVSETIRTQLWAALFKIVPAEELFQTVEFALNQELAVGKEACERVLAEVETVEPEYFQAHA